MIATQAADGRTQANGPVVLGHCVMPMPFHESLLRAMAAAERNADQEQGRHTYRLILT